MLNQHLIASISPLADPVNIVFWKDYRVTVLQDRLFRIEKSSNEKFRDKATQTVWFRNIAAAGFYGKRNGKKFGNSNAVL